MQNEQESLENTPAQPDTVPPTTETGANETEPSSVSEGIPVGSTLFLGCQQDDFWDFIQ